MTRRLGIRERSIGGRRVPGIENMVFPRMDLLSAEEQLTANLDASSS